MLSSALAWPASPCFPHHVVDALAGPPPVQAHTFTPAAPCFELHASSFVCWVNCHTSQGPSPRGPLSGPSLTALGSALYPHSAWHTPWLSRYPYHVGVGGLCTCLPRLYAPGRLDSNHLSLSLRVVVCPGWVVPLVGALSCTPKGCGFSSQSGHILRLRV